jgi:carbon storage regulator
MLVLSRKIGEQITIGNSVKVTVLSFDRGIVRLGIDAPKSISVHRKEVHDKIVEANQKAVKTETNVLKSVIASGQIQMNENIPKTNIEAPAINFSANKES